MFLVVRKAAATLPSPLRTGAQWILEQPSPHPAMQFEGLNMREWALASETLANILTQVDQGITGATDRIRNVATSIWNPPQQPSKSKNQNQNATSSASSVEESSTLSRSTLRQVPDERRTFSNENNNYFSNPINTTHQSNTPPQSAQHEVGTPLWTCVRTVRTTDGDHACVHWRRNNNEQPRSNQSPFSLFEQPSVNTLNVRNVTNRENVTSQTPFNLFTNSIARTNSSNTHHLANSNENLRRIAGEARENIGQLRNTIRQAEALTSANLDRQHYSQSSRSGPPRFYSGRVSLLSMNELWGLSNYISEPPSLSSKDDGESHESNNQRAKKFDLYTKYEYSPDGFSLPTRKF